MRQAPDNRALCANFTVQFHSNTLALAAKRDEALRWRTHMAAALSAWRAVQLWEGSGLYRMNFLLSVTNADSG